MAVPTEAVKEKPPLHAYPEAKVGTQFFSHHGIYSERYNGVCALTGSIVLMASGRYVMFVDVVSGKIMSTPGPENGGVGAVAVHPSRRFYVVCEKLPENPLIRVYTWPSRREVGQFVGGATRGFSACCFSADGTMMATVGMYPDYSLAVWNWKTRGMILRNKCYGSDVYTVLFSSFDSGVLVTGGAGHIKFWSMAKTFTGQKLQGVLGKFGRLEISNVRVLPYCRMAKCSRAPRMDLSSCGRVILCAVALFGRLRRPRLMEQLLWRYKHMITGLVMRAQ
ncbi:hypothetical protein C3747_35g279 [Trypanosoma cruzi]|uniref:Guanine nucleotide-binding protein subunit beta-like protein n=1 Tax=Trypanosoma cruzi TaxID=5693 RepID=A0A2V2X385_TRYCR|nr:hypothetical protein C3747_35g279 [Trypanosoma cruzi]